MLSSGCTGGLTGGGVVACILAVVAAFRNLVLLWLLCELHRLVAIVVSCIHTAFSPAAQDKSHC